MARVLVVEDDPTVAEVVGGYLRRAGFEVDAAADGHAALAAATLPPLPTGPGQPSAGPHRAAGRRRVRVGRPRRRAAAEPDGPQPPSGRRAVPLPHRSTSRGVGGRVRRCGGAQDRAAPGEDRARGGAGCVRGKSVAVVGLVRDSLTGSLLSRAEVDVRLARFDGLDLPTAEDRKPEAQPPAERRSRPLRGESLAQERRCSSCGCAGPDASPRGCVVACGQRWAQDGAVAAARGCVMARRQKGTS